MVFFSLQCPGPRTKKTHPKTLPKKPGPRRAPLPRHEKIHEKRVLAGGQNLSEIVWRWGKSKQGGGGAADR